MEEKCVAPVAPPPGIDRVSRRETNIERAPERAGIGRPLAELLAGSLLTSRGFRLPGADGMAIEDVVVTEYPAALAGGYGPRPRPVDPTTPRTGRRGRRVLRPTR